MNAISLQASQAATAQGDQTSMVATAVHEMSVAVQEVARNAQTMAGAAADANREARQGRDLVQEMCIRDRCCVRGEPQEMATALFFSLTRFHG